MKQYAVEVLEKTSHGIYGKERFALWGLSETSKKRACYFAAEIVAGMTWRELLSDFYKNNDMLIKMFVPFGCNPDEVIGHDWAEKRFSYRAFLE